MRIDSEGPTVIERNPPRVLVVDDDEAICRMLQRALRHWGYLATTAASVDEALEAAAEQRPHVIILDLQLGPDEGLQVLRRLPASARRPLVLACTGRPVKEDIEGVDAVISKPFDVRRLVDRIHGLVRRRRGSPTAAQETRPDPTVGC